MCQKVKFESLETMGWGELILMAQFCKDFIAFLRMMKKLKNLKTQTPKYTLPVQQKLDRTLQACFIMKHGNKKHTFFSLDKSLSTLRKYLRSGIFHPMHIYIHNSLIYLFFLFLFHPPCPLFLMFPSSKPRAPLSQR